MKKLILSMMLCALVITANAGLVAVTVTANDEAHTFYGRTVASPDGSWECLLVAPAQEYVFSDGSAVTDLILRMVDDPEVGIEFGVRANSSATTFSILSEVVVFAPMVNPTAYASAGVTLTDRTPTAGATITGLFAGGKTHQARYNGSSVFANLVSGFSIGSGSQTNSEEYGNAFSMITINDTLTSIESEFKFTLSGKDSASGTSNFVVVPEPSSIIALVGGLGSLLAFRRRRA
jgi:hypothetical protein